MISAVVSLRTAHPHWLYTCAAALPLIWTLCAPTAALAQSIDVSEYGHPAWTARERFRKRRHHRRQAGRGSIPVACDLRQSGALRWCAGGSLAAAER